MDRELHSIHDLLERILLDPSEKPTKLPAWFLEFITDKFSADTKIGSGGFADVYKGQLRNHIVAVKKLKQLQKVGLQESKFLHEVESLMRVKHKNIVRFLGYCSDTQGELLDYEGNNVIAEERRMFLCFEFLPEGSLDNYIRDASGGLEWKMRYLIIKGICEGLNYLHQLKIVHSDLKPANILLDHGMVPKIADFGLARCFDEEQTGATTSNVFGSLGYMAQECFSGKFTLKSDVYSLGVIITEMLTGQKEYPKIENVLESWSSRFQMSQGGTWLEHVKVCAEIGLECMDSNPGKRPFTQEIIERLYTLEHTYGFIGTDISAHIPRRSENIKLLDIHPLELRFPFEPNKTIKCPVTLTNRTYHHVGVWIRPTDFRFHDDDLWEPLAFEDPGFLIMEPHSTLAIVVTMVEQRQLPQLDTCKFEVLMVSMGSNRRDEKLIPFIGSKLNTGSDLANIRVEELGYEVDRAIVTAVIYDDYDPESCQEVIRNQKSFSASPTKFEDVSCLDVHPNETWILVGHGVECLSIWNYKTQEPPVMVLQAPREKTGTLYSSSAKFIAEKEWFATGDCDGWIRVYNYITKDKVKEFEAHHGTAVSSLVVHQTDPFLLSASSIGTSVKLWDWDKSWICTRTFNAHSTGVCRLMFNPRDTNTFASASGFRLKIWDINSLDPIKTLYLDSDIPFDFYNDNHRQFLITGHHKSFQSGNKATISDLQTDEVVHTFDMMSNSIEAIASHPTLPILATIVSLHYLPQLLLWNARTYRLLKWVQLSMDGGYFIRMVFDVTEDLPRLFVARSNGISIIEIDEPMILTGGGN